MKKINYKGKEYKIKFQHKHINQKDVVEAKELFPMSIEGLLGKKLQLNGFTKAFITDDEGNVLVESVANCSVLDQFDRRKGRMIASGRLLKQMSE